MKRVLPACLCCCLFALAQSGVAWGQDKVTYQDRATKKETDATGTIQIETAGKVVIKSTTTAGTKEIPATDIAEVIYEVPAKSKLEYGGLRNDERKADTAAKEEDRKKAVEDAIKGYQKLQKDVAGEKYKYAVRHFQFKVARYLARQADEDSGPVDDAIAALTRFKKDHPESWQLVSCVRLLARLQLDRGDFDAASKAYADLAVTPDITRETKQECELMMARTLIRAKKIEEAEKRLQTIVKSVAGDDPQAIRAKVYLAECLAATKQLDAAVKQLEEVIANTPDNELKAVAYNTLGDCYRSNNRPKDALWQYLWVDVIYHQDRREHQRAIEQLARLFDELGDKTRAKQYQDRLKVGAR